MTGPSAERSLAAAHCTLLYQSCHFYHLQELVIKTRFDLPLMGVKIKINGLSKIWVIANLWASCHGTI